MCVLKYCFWVIKVITVVQEFKNKGELLIDILRDVTELFLNSCRN